MNYKIVARYIKDIDFNIPNSKTFFFYQKILQIIKLILILKVTK